MAKPPPAAGPKPLWAAPPAVTPPTDPDRDTILQIYKAYLEDLGRVGNRHETTRTFYLSVISALFVFLSLAGTTGIFAGAQHPVQIMVGIIGGLISLAWALHMGAFSRIFKAKRSVLNAIENSLPIAPFTQEHSAAPRRIRVTHVDIATALICLVLFVILTFIKFGLPVAVDTAGSSH